LKEIEVDGGNVGEVLQYLTREYPTLTPHLFDEKGNLRSYINIFINDDDIRHLHGETTSLGKDDRVMILPSIAGGRR
jgi:adenylyltransferase/sulfurtransferase